MTTNDRPTESVPHHKPNLPPGHVATEQGFDAFLEYYDQKIKPFGNVILAVVGGIAVVLLGAYYFHTQGEQRKSEAFLRLMEAKDAAEVVLLEAKYSDTAAHPYYLFDAGCRLQEEGQHDAVKLKEALGYFQRLQTRYPGHFVTVLAKARNLEIEADIRWVEDELPKELAKLDEQRRALEGGEKKDEGKEPPKKDEPQDGAKKEEPPKDDSKKEEPPKDEPKKDAPQDGGSK